MAAYYVATTGGTGAGTIGDPWSLAHALSGAGGTVQPGDTIWLRGGLYQQAGAFTQTVSGTAGNDVTFRNYPGEFVRIESTNTGDIESLRVDASHYHWRATLGQAEGIFITRGWAENPRISARGSPLWIRGVPSDGGKFSHLVSCEGDSGVYMGNSAGNDFSYGDCELYGMIAFNCGHAPKVHHNAYLRHTPPGLLTVEGFIGFNSCNMGMQIYSQDGTGGLQGIRVKKSVIFNAGQLGDLSSTTNNYVIVNGIAGVKINDFTVEDCISYHPNEGSLLQGFSFGEDIGGTLHEAAELARLYIIGGSLRCLRIGPFRVDGNPSINVHDVYANPKGAAISMVECLQSGSLANFSGWANNAWRRDVTQTAWRNGGVSRNFANWKISTEIGASDTAPTADPTENKVFVFPLTKYNPGYGHVCVFNWESLDDVNVNLSGLLNVGDSYEIYNIQNISASAGLGAPSASGTYQGGNVPFPMDGVTPPSPIGVLPGTAPTTGPFFNAFFVRRVGVASEVVRGGGPPPPVRIYVVDVPPWKSKHKKGKKR